MSAHPVPPASEVRAIRRAVLRWYDVERRAFPWRGTRDPYAVLVSEVMLQQTQAARVAPRFTRFMARFPSARALADASPADLLAEWSGLGYNRRALALQRAARHVAEHGWPGDVAGLERLPGVGRYTARALASLAFGAPLGVVDTNVRRWLLRRFGEPDRPARLRALADALAAPGRAERVPAWTHATMELGARVCRARAPLCTRCPLAHACPARGAAAPVPVPRQPALRGSDRAHRGAVLRALATTTRHAADESDLRRRLARDEARIGSALEDIGWERVLGGLERDGLIHRSRGRVMLGPG